VFAFAGVYFLELEGGLAAACRASEATQSSEFRAVENLRSISTGWHVVPPEV